MSTEKTKGQAGDFYITTTLPYVNADLHAGHAMELIRADVIARYKKLQGFNVFFNTGTDEHGMKMFESAQKAGQTPQQYTDYYAARFKEGIKKFGLSDDVHTVRTTDEGHKKAAQAFWKKCADNGYIYKKNYKTKYCVGCEEEKTDSELVDGKCPIHPNRELELIEEENYFFKYSAFGEKLLAYYDAHPQFVVPSFRVNELREFIKRGLEDFSISRLKSKMSWGVPVPGDEDHVMYVWFDALVNYISTLGWPENEAQFTQFWKNGTPVQYCGKDNIRFQAAMWQAMLMAAELPNTHTVIVNGHVTAEGGVKMSKSLGNGIDPYQVVEEFGTDALRYFVTKEIHPYEDSPFTMERFKESYNAGLANGIGNLLSRIMKMATTHIDTKVEIENKIFPNQYIEAYHQAFNEFNLQKAANIVWDQINDLDRYIQETAPFKLVKENKEEGVKIIKQLVERLYRIADLLQPFTPTSAEQIKYCIENHTMPATPLFVRKD